MQYRVRDSDKHQPRNTKQEALTKWKCGWKADLILRTTAELEFGGGEAGRIYKSEKDTKWLLESGMKLPKMLKDMLAQLAAEVNWSKRTLRELLVVGFVHDGKRNTHYPSLFGPCN